MLKKRKPAQKRQTNATTAVLEPINDSGPDSLQTGDSSRCDGSRTAPDTKYEIMWRHQEGMTIAAIARETHCDHRTVSAVIANWGTAPHTLRLQAHRPQVVDNLILGMHEAAKRGKLDSILNLSHTLGITQAPNSHAPTLAVQVVLNGGHVPNELSPAKAEKESETITIQAVIPQSPDNDGYVNLGAIGQQPTQAQAVTVNAGVEAEHQATSSSPQAGEAAA